MEICEGTTKGPFFQIFFLRTLLSSQFFAHELVQTQLDLYNRDESLRV